MIRSAAAVMLVCVAGSVQRPATIQIGTASLYLGMSEQQVEAALQSPFSIQKQSQDSFASWYITAPTLNAKFSPIAAVAFLKGRLNSVRRYWGPSDQQAGIPLAKALYGAASQMVMDGRRNCVLDVASRQDPGIDQRTIFLTCSGKRLEIAIVESPNKGAL